VRRLFTTAGTNAVASRPRTRSHAAAALSAARSASGSCTPANRSCFVSSRHCLSLLKFIPVSRFFTAKQFNFDASSEVIGHALPNRLDRPTGFALFIKFHKAFAGHHGPGKIRIKGNAADGFDVFSLGKGFNGLSHFGV